MKILIVDRKLLHKGWQSKEGEELKLAFEHLGHSVTVAGKEYENDEHSIEALSKNHDFCIISENYWQDWSWFDFKNINIPKLLWAIDYDPSTFSNSNSMRQLILDHKINHVFVIDSSLIEYGEYETSVKHSYLPYAASTLHHEVDCEKDIDVSFIGSQYESRLAMFPKQTKYITDVFGEDYMRAISRSKINLNLSLTNAINGKVFEIIGCKGFLITNETKDTNDLFGDHLITYKDRSDLLKKVEKYVKLDSDRETIRNECYDFVRAYHMYENRAQQIIEVANKLG